MKSIILLLALIFIGASIFTAFQQNNEQETSVGIPAQVMKENDKLGSSVKMSTSSQVTQPEIIRRYRVTVSTIMRNDKTQLGNVKYRFNLALKATDDHSGVYLGQAYDIQLGANPYSNDPPKNLAFTVQFSA